MTIGIVAGIIGFLILALLLMSVILYILVRRSVEKRQDKEICVREGIEKFPEFIQDLVLRHRILRKYFASLSGAD